MGLWARLSQSVCLWHLPVPVPVNESFVQSLEGNVTNHYIWVYIMLMTHKLNSELSCICVRQSCCFLFCSWLCKCASITLILILSLRIRRRLWKGRVCASVGVYISVCGFQVCATIKCPTKPLVLCKHADQSLLSVSVSFNMLYLNFISLCARLAKRWGTHQRWRIDLSVGKFLCSCHLPFTGIMEMLSGSHGSSPTWDNRCHGSGPVGQWTPSYLCSCLCRSHVLTAPHHLTELFVPPVIHIAS